MGPCWRWCCAAHPPIMDDWDMSLVGYASMVAEVHVYDVTTGECLQSLPLRSHTTTISWSRSSGLLAVYSHHDFLGDPDLGEDEDDVEPASPEMRHGAVGDAEEGGGSQMPQVSGGVDDARALDPHDAAATGDSDDSAFFGHAFCEGFTIYNRADTRFQGQIRLLHPRRMVIDLVMSHQDGHSRA